MLNNVLFQNFQAYNKYDLLRNETLNKGPGLREILFMFIFVTPQKTYFLLLHWSALKNWSV